MAAEAIVSAVLEQLTSNILSEVVEEVRLVTDVRKEIENLISNFRAIQAVLVDAEQRQVKETAVGVWLDRLKDASYDMDDVLDEWNTAILKLQIEGVVNAQIPKKIVSFMFSSPCFCFRQVALRHEIGVKIKRLNEKLDSIAIEKDRYNLNTIGSIEKPQRSETTSFIEVSEIHGREDDKKKLVNMLLSESNEALPVFSIVGMGGIGKTTLAQSTCNDARIKSKFDKIIWVCVSNPFDEIKIARAIIEGFTDEATNLVTFQSLLKHIRKTIENKKFLLILDDVWAENDDKWGPLYNSLNDGLHGESKILVTTRKETVARMMKSTDVINIGVLSLDESWSLFTQLAFWDRSHEEREELENIGREIVGKCKGLPLAIKTIGSLLRFKKTRDQWQRILDSEMWKPKELEERIFPPLLLSYNDLPCMVKRCFSYCAIFPKDYMMAKDELIKLWMAQGYLGLKHDEEIEIIGDECFDTLAVHSFFQEFEKDEYGNINKCKMHEIVHDFAQFLVKNECFSKKIYGSEEASLDVSCEKARHSMLMLKSSYNVNISSVQKLRSLLIEGELGYESVSSCFSPNLFEQMTCLRSLKLSGSWDNKIPSEIGKLIHLRYLTMSRINIKELPERMCCLYNLQTLDISECMSLEKLPKGMGKLINLQTLNISGCWSLVKLPKGMEKLINLRHLINRGTKNLRYMPKEIERLVCLLTLGRLIVGGDPNGMGLGCLKNLNKLRGGLQLVGLGEVVHEAEAKNAQLMNKKNLVELELYFDSDEEYASHRSEISSVEECNKDSSVLEALQPPPNLEILIIDGCRMTFPPHWMVSLIHLKKLSLNRCSNCEYLPANLGKLPWLEELYIEGMESVKRVDNEFVGIETSSSSSSSPSLIAFPKLKTLGFQEMENWEEWEYKITAADITIMPSLSELQIKDCPKLKSLPDQLLHCTSLEKLTIWNCNCEYLPALGKLPLLEELDIRGMKSVKRVGNEFVGIETSSSSSSSPSLIAFPKLKTLIFQDMWNWEEWEYKITAGDITIMPSLSKLSIIGCPELKSLPDYLLHATTLERLDFQRCKFECLPANLGKLPRLEFLRIWYMESVKKVGNEFVGIETSSSSSSSPSLIAFPKLKTLDIYNMENWEEWEYKITAGDITIMPSLSHLTIRYCPKLKSLPDHLLHATSLEQLTIDYCNCEYLPALGKLPHLEYLEIEHMKSVKRVGNEFVGIETSSSSSSSPSLIAFPKLKSLCIHQMENWEEWEYKITAADITIMPSLSELRIFYCPKLKSLPDHLLHATTLERLTIWSCNCEYLPALGKLPRLQYLSIEGLKSVKRVGNEFVGIETSSSSSSSSSPSLIAFPKLKTLNIWRMENWEEWEYKITAGDITIMSSLSKLSIYKCPKLKSLPDHLLHATTLETLDIFQGCDILEQVYKVENGQQLLKRK